MPESLSITYDELRTEIGRFLGFRSVEDWSDEQSGDVHDIIKSGLRKFYWPVVGGEKGPEIHQWSFLKTRGSISIVTGTHTYDLASDFGSMISGPTFPEGSGKRIIEIVPEEDLIALLSKVSLQGTPSYAAVRSKFPAINEESESEIIFYPIPLLNDTLSYRYMIDPPMLSTDNPIPLGGPFVSLAILEACLCEAEKTLGDTEGLHAKKFQEALMVCIAFDRGAG
jgi:hypothetical protein